MNKDDFDEMEREFLLMGGQGRTPQDIEQSGMIVFYSFVCVCTMLAFGLVYMLVR